MKILIIEDDYTILESLELSLKLSWQDLEILTAKLGKEGLKIVNQENPDLVILDLGLPDIDGYTILKKIRESSKVPILILSIRSDEMDVVKGLEWGADDYLIKPFKQLELIARIRSIIKRREEIRSDLYISCGPFSLNCRTNNLFFDNNSIKLTNTETLILHKLICNAGSVVSHSSLIKEIWTNSGFGASEAIRVYIRHLRLKIEPNPSNPQFIITKPGGYLFQITTKTH